MSRRVQSVTGLTLTNAGFLLCGISTRDTKKIASLQRWLNWSLAPVKNVTRSLRKARHEVFEICLEVLSNFAHSSAACERYFKLWGSVGIGMFAGFQFGLRLSKKDREELLMTKENHPNANTD